jgi:cytochrome c556
MIRTVLTVAAILGVTTAVVAQTDAVTARKQLMGEMAMHAWRALPMMAKGQTPYDQSKVNAAFVALSDAAKKIPALYPKGTEGATAPGSNYVASASIWQNKPDFEARVAKFEADIGIAKSKATGAGGLNEAVSIVNDSCTNCHRPYRVRK